MNRRNILSPQLRDALGRLAQKEVDIWLAAKIMMIIQIIEAELNRCEHTRHEKMAQGADLEEINGIYDGELELPVLHLDELNDIKMSALDLMNLSGTIITKVNE
jgi:hypothetical protein